MGQIIKINEIVKHIESVAPPALQESYDNTGLIIGDGDKEVSSALLTIDVTEFVVDEAIEKGAGVIIAHHPVIFSGIRKLTGKSYVERTVLKAIKHDIAIIAAHTNLDAAAEGVNAKICQKIGLNHCHILRRASGHLKKLVTFVPRDSVANVRNAVFAAGAGNIGNYDSCGFNLEGTGSFRGNSESNPYVGTPGTIHYEKEVRFETIFPSWRQHAVIEALIAEHPYEEVAYDLYPLENSLPGAGMGMIGNLPEPMPESDFLALLKERFHAGVIRHTLLSGKKISRIAVCGGSGSFLLPEAIAGGADVFVSADFKYHQFFDADKNILIADIGHYESEQFTKELFFELLVKKFPKFALHFSEVNTNPIYYF